MYKVVFLKQEVSHLPFYRKLQNFFLHCPPLPPPKVPLESSLSLPPIYPSPSAVIGFSLPPPLSSSPDWCCVLSSLLGRGERRRKERKEPRGDSPFLLLPNRPFPQSYGSHSPPLPSLLSQIELEEKASQFLWETM